MVHRSSPVQSSMLLLASELARYQPLCVRHGAEIPPLGAIVAGKVFWEPSLTSFRSVLELTEPGQSAMIESAKKRLKHWSSLATR